MTDCSDHFGHNWGSIKIVAGKTPFKKEMGISRLAVGFSTVSNDVRYGTRLKNPIFVRFVFVTVDIYG